jgi:hypothetical protein
MIPGSNLFRQATRLITPVLVPYYMFQGRALNDNRQWVSTFEPPVDVLMSVQAVQRITYVQYGLDLKRNYIKIYTDSDIVALDRNSSGDRLIWNNDWFQLEDENTWYLMDGWASALAVKVDDTSPAVEPYDRQ